MTAQRSVEVAFREEHGRIVAALTRRFGDVDLAEDMAQEAFVEALRRWPAEGLPPNPGGWLTTTARHRALDRLRRESTRTRRQEEAMAMLDDPAPAADPTSVVDDRLRLFFMCCHPSLSTEVQVALTLRLLGGLTVAEIAEAFLVEERAMAQRITRAKRKIRAANIPFRLPPDAELPTRLRGVLGAIYLVFNEGYLASSGDRPIREDLCAEAIRLGRVVHLLMPDEPEVVGLLALMLLTDARRPARIRDATLVPLGEQDRRLWDRTLVDEGHGLVRWCLRRGRPGHYQLLAAVNAVHTDAPTAAQTDWRQILRLYDQLVALSPTPVVRLNRAVAVAEVDGPMAGLEAVDGLGEVLDGYHPFHATRADLLRRLGRAPESEAAYGRAIELAANRAEREFLAGRRRALVGSP